MVDEHVDADCIDRESFDASLRRDGSKLSLPRRAACQFDDLFWLLLTPNDTTGRLMYNPWSRSTRPADAPSRTNTRIELRHLSQTRHPQSRYTTITRADILFGTILA